jgi:Acetyltransferase (GNAT) domain
MNNPIQKSDKESYIFLCQNEATIPLFMQPEWLDVVCEKDLIWDVVLSKNKEGVVEAALVFCLKKKWGITQITMPHFTQFTGFWFLEKLSQDIDNQQVIVEKLLNRLPKKHRTFLRFHYDFQDITLFKKNGFYTKQFKTQIIENVANLDIAYQKLSRDVQRNIKKAGQNFRVVVKDNFEVFFKLANSVFERQNTPNPLPLSIWKSVHKLIHHKGWGRVYHALDNNNEAHAVVMVVWDAKTMYILASGSTEKGRKYGGMTQLIWQAISDSLGQHETVNFLGSSIPAIQAFNLRFNAENKTYFSVEKYQNKWIEMLFEFRKK